MRIAFTDKALSALKSKADRYEMQDTYCPGLAVRVTPEGRKTFNVKYRYGLAQKRMSLGVYPRMSLADARTKAMEVLRHVDEGTDPAKRRQQTDLRVDAVVAEFITRYAKPRNRKWMESERILLREFVAVFGKKDIREVTRQDVIEIMDGAIERGAHYQANRILSNVRKLYNWTIERGIVERSPIVGLKAPTKEIARERMLDDIEIKAVLRACLNDTYPFRQFVPLLLATGQRRGEMANMRWSELDLVKKTWRIPSERSKNGKAHVVPLSAYALDLIAEVPRFLDCDFVFTTTRRSPVSGFSKALRRLWLATGSDDWRYHDLRRTAASGMASLEIEPHVIEKILNHMTGKIAGIARVYNVYNYLKEAREALECWGTVLGDMAREEGS